MLAVVPGLFPSTVIGVAKPLLRLHLQERITLDLKLPFLVNRRSVERADVIVICRVLSAAFARILEWVRAAGTPLIYELDDNLVDVPEDIPGLEYARDPGVRRLLIDSLRAAGVVRVYSPALRDRLAEYSDRVQLVTGPLEWTLIPDQLPPKDGRPRANGLCDEPRAGSNRRTARVAAPAGARRVSANRVDDLGAAGSTG